MMALAHRRTSQLGGHAKCRRPPGRSSASLHLPISFCISHAKRSQIELVSECCRAQGQPATLKVSRESQSNRVGRRKCAASHTGTLVAHGALALMAALRKTNLAVERTCIGGATPRLCSLPAQLKVTIAPAKRRATGVRLIDSGAGPNDSRARQASLFPLFVRRFRRRRSRVGQNKAGPEKWVIRQQAIIFAVAL
jgi:hypothetical protein